MLYEVFEGEYTQLLATLKSGMNNISNSPVVHIWLPEEQVLFPKKYNRKTFHLHSISRITAFGSLDNSTSSEYKTFYFDLDSSADTVHFFSNGYPVFTRYVFSKNIK